MNSNYRHIKYKKTNKLILKKGCESEFPYCFLTDFMKFVL